LLEARARVTRMATPHDSSLHGKGATPLTCQASARPGWRRRRKYPTTLATGRRRSSPSERAGQRPYAAFSDIRNASCYLQNPPQAPLAQPRRCTIAPTAEGSRSGPIRVFHTRRNTAPSVGPLAGAGFSHRSGGNSDALGLLRRRHCDCGSSITWYFVAVLLGSGTTDCKTLSARYRNILHNRHLRQSKGNQGLRRPGPGGCKILPRRALIANQSGCRIRCSRVELAA